MACSANGSAVEYYMVMEVAGAIPGTAPNFLPIRYSTSSLARQTAQVDSNEINPDRQRPVSKQGTYSVSGDISGELSDDSFDALLECALQGTWATNTLKVGNTERSFAILERHTDIGVDYIYRGCHVNTVTVSAAVDAAVAITFGVVGTKAEVYTLPGDAVLGTAGTSGMMVTSSGSLTEGGVALGYATALDFTLNNGMAPTFALFQREAFCVQNGVMTASGTLSAYLKDGTLYAKHLNETPTTLEAVFSDGTNTRTFTFPSVLYTQASKGVSGPGAIVTQYTFSAGYGATAATTATVSRSA